jgi:hypothetical protein
MSKRYWFLLSACVSLFAVAILSLRPVSIPEERDCLTARGIVTEISEGGVKDLVIRLSGRKEYFYVNRGLERELNLNDLKDQLTGKEILLKYANHWTPLDPARMSIHISKIEYRGRTLFTELR